MGLGAVWTTTDQCQRRLVSLAEFASLHAIGDQLSGGGDPIRVKLYGTFAGFIGPLEHRLATVGIVGVKVAAHSELLPCRRVGGVDIDHMFQNRDGILVRRGIMGQREAVQVEIVGFGVFRARPGLEKTAGCTDRRQQPLPYLGRNLRL